MGKPNRAAINVLVRIDPNKLDSEGRDQSRRVWQYGELFADAKHRLKQATDALGVIEAQLKLDIARNPGRYGLDGKPTVPVMEAAVTVHPKRQAALLAVQEAQHETDIFRVACKALYARGRMLENDTELAKIHYRTARVHDAGPDVRRSLPANNTNHR